MHTFYLYIKKKSFRLQVLHCDSQPFLPHGTFGQQYHNLMAPLDAKIGLKVNESENL